MQFSQAVQPEVYSHFRQPAQGVTQGMGCPNVWSMNTIRSISICQHMSAYVSKDLPALDTFTSEFTEFLIISLCWRQGWSIWHGSRLSWICSIFSSDCPRRVSQLPTVMPISNIFNHLCIADSFLNGLLCFFEDSTHARTVA